MTATSNSNDYWARVLQNGFILVRNYGSGLESLYNKDGSQRTGYFRLTPQEVLGLILPGNLTMEQIVIRNGGDR